MKHALCLGPLTWTPLAEPRRAVASIGLGDICVYDRVVVVPVVIENEAEEEVSSPSQDSACILAAPIESRLPNIFCCIT